MNPDIVYACNGVKRYHTVPTLQQQTVGQHTVNMLGLLMYIGYEPRREFYEAVLTHDWPEVWTGDLPAHSKKKMGVAWDKMEMEWYDTNGVPYHTLTLEEEWVLSWLDCMEGTAFCVSEMRLGNQIIREVYNRYRGALGALMNREQYHSLPQEVQARIDQLCDQLTSK